MSFFNSVIVLLSYEVLSIATHALANLVLDTNSLSAAVKPCDMTRPNRKRGLDDATILTNT